MAINGFCLIIYENLYNHLCFKPGIRQPQFIFIGCMFYLNVCVCLWPRLLIISGVMLTLYD